MKKEEQLFFVYGSLKRGYWNNGVLGNAEFLGEFITEPKYTLFNGTFPVIERGGDTAVHGELFYSKNSANIASVFNLEGCESQVQGDEKNWYDFDTITTPHGEAVIFVMNKGESGRSNILKSGIWK